jgi:outer membrane protein TolC
MMPSRIDKQLAGRRLARFLLAMVGVLSTLAGARAQQVPATPAPLAVAAPGDEAPPPRLLPPGTGADAPPPALGMADAIRWAIEHNPNLATIRKQHGIAAAGLVIAATYPFNPIVQDFVWGDNGPASAGITSHVFNEHTARLDLELRGQGKIRRSLAHATLTRTDWEIAAQEVLVGVQAIRAFDTALYRREKLRVLEETVRLQEGVAGLVGRLVEQNQMPRTELILARADVVDAKAALGPARSLTVAAHNDLLRLLGAVTGDFAPQGNLDQPAWSGLDEAALVEAAQGRRPDLHALEVAVQEAESRFRLEVANRWGNPSLGPAYEHNETSVNFVGMWLIWQIPILNNRKGDILQRQAERARAVQAVHSLEVTVRQDVRAALNRLAAADEMVAAFRNDTLPALRQAREGLEKLFAAGEPGVTLARIIAIRLRLLTAYSNYLDALFERAQARADLAAAVGDPSLVLVGTSPPAPATLPAPDNPPPAR